ncbi:putative PPC domain-containing protein [Rosa chinensis]|uniref:Putative PPC domain-containing protein n=1 Tax=Rosa chinensis TaxID=74649 RepID=A0A2P6PH42_ROSCH|nr:AT-hook motif nuclear-localized protein 17 [Rosa chinensis]PRQ21227.1 putative PPC domain-containing protein [Rosa chinensis]
MKGEYGGGDTKSETQNMFSKLHHHNNPQSHPHPHPHHPQQQQQQQFHHHFSNPFQITPVRECQPQTSEEEDTSRTSSGTATKPLVSDPNNPTGGDGATIEVVRRPRGRPPGSKNKPKPPVIITRDTEPAMSPYILEVPGGSDVVDAVSRFCCRKNIGLVILTGSGTVANVTLRQPSTTPGATVTFHGRFDILSISATFLPQSTAAGPIPNGFTISLAGPQGQIVGGLVAGALIAAGTVYIIAASFNSPSYHRLPVEDEAAPRNSVSGGEAQSPPLSTGGESGGHAPAQSCGMAMYSCHLPTDVIWAPTARQPPPPPPY